MENNIMDKVKTEDLEECGCCGCWHKKGYCGDCRNDDERYIDDDPPMTATEYRKKTGRKRKKNLVRP